MNNLRKQYLGSLCTILLISSPMLKAQEAEKEHSKAPAVPGRATAPRETNDCEKVDEKNAAKLLPKSDQLVGKLFLSTTLFSSRFKEIQDLPSVKALQKTHPTAEDPLLKSLAFSTVSSFAFGFLAGFGGLSIESWREGEPLVGGPLWRGSQVFGALMVSASVSFVWHDKRAHRLDEEGHELTKANEAKLRQQVGEAISGPVQFYADIFGWPASNEEVFRQKFLNRTIEVVTGSSHANHYSDSVTKINQVDPLDIVEEMEPSRTSEVQALRELRKIVETVRQEGKIEVPQHELVGLSSKKIALNLQRLVRAESVISTIVGEVRSGTPAQIEGKRLLEQIKKAEQQLRDLCKLASE